MPIPLPATTDVIIKTANPPIVTLFTVRCTENVDVGWTKELTAIEELDVVEPLLEDIRFTRQVFKVTGNLVSTVGITPEAGDDDLLAQYTQFKLALDRDELLAIEVQTNDGNILENGHFQSASITFVEGEITKARITFEFIVGGIYWRI